MVLTEGKLGTRDGQRGQGGVPPHTARQQENLLGRLSCAAHQSRYGPAGVWIAGSSKGGSKIGGGTGEDICNNRCPRSTGGGRSATRQMTGQRRGHGVEAKGVRTSPLEFGNGRRRIRQQSSDG